MTTGFDVVVPALHLQHAPGRIEEPTTRLYAERAAATWVDYFILSGSTTRGQQLSAQQRATVLDLWLDVANPERLLACCWEPDDFGHAASRGITPMATMRNLRDQDHALAFLQALPAGAYIYSHPKFGQQTFDVKLADAARRQGVMPAGGKVAKLATAEVSEISQAAGADFRLWDGSSRRIDASLDAGAAGVVATPLCAFDPALPAKEADLLQAAIDPVQHALDVLPDRASRTDELLRRAREGLHR